MNPFDKAGLDEETEGSDQDWEASMARENDPVTLNLGARLKIKWHEKSWQWQAIWADLARATGISKLQRSWRRMKDRRQNKSGRAGVITGDD